MPNEYSYATITFDLAKGILAKHGKGEKDLPLLFMTDPLTKESTIYTGEIETSAIQVYL